MNFQLVIQTLHNGCVERRDGSLPQLMISLDRWFVLLVGNGYVIDYKPATCEFLISHPKIGFLNRVTLEVAIKRGG